MENFQVSGSSNAAGGQDVNVSLNKPLESGNQIVGASAFVSNTKKGQTSYGGAINYNVNDHGLSTSKVITPIESITSQSAHVNLLNSGPHKIDTNLQHSNIEQKNGVNFDTYHGSVNYNHTAGHAASVGLTNTPKFDSRVVDVSAKANLWTSPSSAATLDATASGSRTFGGAFHGQKNFGGGLHFNGRF